MSATHLGIKFSKIVNMPLLSNNTYVTNMFENFVKLFLGIKYLYRKFFFFLN